MIVVDLSQVMHASIAAQVVKERGRGVVIEEGMLRHMVLNTIRAIKVKFGAKYGEVVMATDSSSWRKQFFPYYKFRRAEAREVSLIDWNSVFKSMTTIKAELREYMPYRVVAAAGAEADDVIGELSRYVTSEPVFVVSGDHDFKQLHNDNVKQYDWVNKKSVTVASPKDYLLDHIIRGDKSDGIPNILSDDSVFVDGKRQEVLSAKRYNDLVDKANRGVLQGTRNWIRNQTLVDLSKTPSEICDAIRDSFNSQAAKGREKMFNYFVSAKLKNLMESLGDF